MMRDIFPIIPFSQLFVNRIGEIFFLFLKFSPFSLSIPWGRMENFQKISMVKNADFVILPKFLKIPYLLLNMRQDVL